MVSGLASSPTNAVHSSKDSRKPWQVNWITLWGGLGKGLRQELETPYVHHEEKGLNDY